LRTMREMFAAYWLVILGGITLYFVVGVTHS
jgi:hypothetical protein